MKFACWSSLYVLIPSGCCLTFSFFLRRLPLCASCSRSATGRAIPEAPVLASTTTFSSFLFSPPGGLASLYFSLFSRAFSSCSFNFVASSYKLWCNIKIAHKYISTSFYRNSLIFKAFKPQLNKWEAVQDKKKIKVLVKTSLIFKAHDANENSQYFPWSLPWLFWPRVGSSPSLRGGPPLPLHSPLLSSHHHHFPLPRQLFLFLYQTHYPLQNLNLNFEELLLDF